MGQFDIPSSTLHTDDSVFPQILFQFELKKINDWAEKRKKDPKEKKHSDEMKKSEASFLRS